MNKINYPSLRACWFEQNVYNISYSSDETGSMFTIVAPSALAAVQAFAYLYPSRDILNITCCGPCISLYPFCHE